MVNVPRCRIDNFAVGLTLLLAHLLTTRKSFLKNANLRVFTFAQQLDKIEEEKKKFFDSFILMFLHSLIYTFI